MSLYENAHGGQLVNQWTFLKPSADREIELSDWAFSDFELIANGAFSPLTGFMNKADYLSVLSTMHLSNGTIWSLPITLSVSKEQADSLEKGDIATLTKDGIAYGWMSVEEVYEADLMKEAACVYGTTDANHPGVSKTFAKDPFYVAGTIYQYQLFNDRPFANYYRTPIELRQLFKDLNWKTVVGFQTRNPIHRAHEYIQKCALESVDGLLINPLVGETKEDDVPASIRMKAYETIIKHYYNKNRVKLSIYPAAMRYAGPKEAIMHAIVRKNYGCTHFIVGRDHAGVGNYYGTYEAQELISQYEKEIGISIFKFEHAFYCSACENMATVKTCSHDSSHHIHLSGTKVREMLKAGIRPPKEFSRPEVADLLISEMTRKEI
jgi:sulfate adenylyltransferase